MSTPLSPLIHLIDDDEAVRSGLALLIGTVGLRVQAWSRSAGSSCAGFDRARTSAPSCSTCACPGISGLTVLDTLIAQGVDQPVIMLTGHGTVEMCRRAFKAGAAEFLEKPVDDEPLLEALQNAVRQAREVAASAWRPTAQARERYAQLSEREREVLGLIVAGLTNKEIGRALVAVAAHRGDAPRQPVRQAARRHRWPS